MMTLSLNWCFQERVLKLGPHNINTHTKMYVPLQVVYLGSKDEKLVLVHKTQYYTPPYGVCVMDCNYVLQEITLKKLLHHAAKGSLSGMALMSFK